ncbi:MAG TPA: AfsR/SARP family transcriptional regulator, partial [Ilumatobacteraceae bacterium]|nr:AfsR/SARP family transcriptional regulator [Ilumatobacteraceae bacterium]
MSGSRMCVRVLGPVSLISEDGPVPLGGALPRAFLAVLALESPRPVSLDRLTALLWGDFAPAGVKGAVQQIASRVRRALAVAGLAEGLRAVPPGYALDVAPGEIDVRVFRARARAGIEAQRRGDHDTAAVELSNALALWTGGALVDLVDLPLAGLLAPSLDDERWRAEELRAEALLAAGRPGECADLVAAATAEAPLRERLWVLQARALAAAGRRSDAVRCARTGIAVITAELGVPPGPELASLEDDLRALPASAEAVLRVVPPIVPRNELLEAALQRAMANAEQAAAAATARFAHGEAVRQWQRALELLDTVDPGDDAHRLRILLGLGDAHNTASLDAEACEVFVEAARIARRSRDGPGLGWAALGYCGDRIGFTPPKQQRELLDEALAGLDPGESLLRGRLLARLATERYWTDSVDRTLELAEEAVREAAKADDDETRLLARYA